MDIVYRILTKVNIEHEFNSKPGFRFVKAYISQREAGNLLNLGLIFKPTASGIVILYDSNRLSRETMLSANRQAINNEFVNIFKDNKLLEDTFLTSDHEVIKNASIEINLLLDDPCFFNYTGNAENTDDNYFTDIDQNSFYFTNNADNTNLPYLHKQKTVGTSELRIKESQTGDKFGVVKLKLLPELREEYVIRFGNRLCYWQYILTLNFLTALKSLEQLAIVDKNGSVAFTGPETIPSGPVKGPLVFTSKKTYPPAWNADTEFKLVELAETSGGSHRIIIETLPIPAVNVARALPYALKDADVNRFFFKIFI